MDRRDLPTGRPARRLPDAPLTAAELFPRRLDFFGLGQVETVARKCTLASLADAETIILFRVIGEEAGLCVVAFDRRPQDEEARSMLAELANILCAKLATRMAEVLGAAMEISPPEFAGTRSGLLAATLRGAASTVASVRSYRYEGKDGAKFGFKMAYLPGNREART